MKEDGDNTAIARVHAEAAGTESGSTPRMVKPRLLLVDDEKQVLAGLALHLRRKYDVVTRTSGAAALQALDSGDAFAAVISDLRMPHMDGVELLEEIRRRSPGTTRLLLTGYADVTSAIAAVNQAAVHRFLTKPCAPAQLARALEEALASASVARGETMDEDLTRLGRQATLGTMAGSIGHEIGNLVTALSGSLEAVRLQVERGELPSPEDIGLMGLVKTRLQEHTRALMDLSCTRERKVENLDIGGLVCASVAILQKAGVLKVPRVHIVLPHATLYVDGDRALLEGVLFNLLKNAAEALAEKADAEARAARTDYELPEITIRVTALRQDAVAVVVEDNGPGVPERNLDRIFTTYFTTKSASGGTGLGLAIVRETVEQHRGRIDVASVRGKGTRFTIELPLAGCGALLESADADAEADAAVDSQGGSILRLVPRRG